MRIRLLFLTAFILFLGCTKKVEVVRSGVSPILKGVTWKFHNLTEGTWAVGETYRDVVTKNVTVVIGLPELTSSDMKFLSENHGVDSWLLKIIHKNSAGSLLQLATLYAPMRAMNKGKRDGQVVRSVSFSLTYPAWAMSERFRKFQCPAFSHNKRLGDYKKIEEKTEMEFPVSALSRFDEKYTLNDLVPPKIVFANSLIGDYYIEAALLNTTNKTLYSSFRKIPIELKILEENHVEIKGCSGVHQEYESRSQFN
jgi:hypothetical protein